MFGKAKNHNSNLWKSKNSEFQCLKKPKFTLLMFGKAKNQNSNVWKGENLEFQCLEKAKTRIQIFLEGRGWGCFSLYFCLREDDILNSLIQHKPERS